MSPGFIAMQGHKYSHFCNLWGKFLPVGMICTTTNTISTPVGEMCLHARMFRTLAPYVLYSHGCNVRAWNLFWACVAKLVLWQLIILLPCTLAHTSSIPMGAINFYMQEHFFTLADVITPIFTMLTKVWPRANRAMVKNDSTVLTEVCANQNRVNRGFPIYITIWLSMLCAIIMNNKM